MTRGYNAQKFPWSYEMAQNKLDANSLFLFGRNHKIDTATDPEMLTDFSTDGNYPFLSTPEELFISSSSALDTSVVIVCRMLDVNWNVKDVVVTLNGQNTVQVLGGPFVRCLIAFNGGAVDQDGDVHVYRTSTVTNGVPLVVDTLMKVSVINQQSSAALFTVPSGFTGYIGSLIMTINRNSTGGSSDIGLVTKAFNGVKRVRGELGLQTSGDSVFNYVFPIPVRIGEKTDIWLEASVTNNNTDIAAGFQVSLIKE